ncbi:glycosyltransferase family 4 protein [Actinomadura graeca]|uniref:Glycosyltransferase family 4 protein n=1 Tax=Actinomadura graeca TaxID=2750812 RepID=A0ABX8QTM7_9ACTN|nr:glycosyltransferase family 4 protein [Actinomadura graeca]QXJ21544.1 glycosyltransferase family 4 protein [Actinomadura graeca]
MRILVYPHAMEIGGSQLNAIELAGAVRDLGHEVVVAGEPGPLVERVLDAGIEHVPLDAGRRRPSPSTVRLLGRLAEERGFDVVHGYEWPPGVEAFYTARRRAGTAAVCTVMSMAVAPFLPPSLPLVVGTEQIRRDVLARRGRRPGSVHLIEPPVDVRANAPGHPTAAFRERFGLDKGPLDVVVVCRLVAELKLEGLLTAVDVVGDLAAGLPLRLVVVGDGPCRDQVEARAARANARAGRRTVVLTGQLDDPRPAYAAATIALGMGGSALRALAFGRPLIVQGERGYFEPLTPGTAPTFLAQGWYGVGGGGAERLAEILRDLAADEVRRKELGEYGRRLVTERFSLERAARVQEAVYREALSAPGRARRDAAATAARVAGYKIARKARKLRGPVARDDFNAVARGETR